MIVDSKWALKTVAAEPTAADLRETFTFTAATPQTSGVIDLKAIGYADGGGELFLHVSRTGTYTKNVLTNMRVAISHADAASADPIAYDSTLTSPVEAVGVDVPVAAIDASSNICKIPLPPGLKRYIAVTMTPTGAPTTISLQGRIVTG